MNEIERVGVVGAGVMGTGIAEACAAADLDVRVAVSRPGSADRGRERLARSLDRKVSKGRLSPVHRKEILDRIVFTTDLGDLADRQLVIESVPEDEAAKREIFAALDGVVTDPDTILASNTSSIPVIKLGRATSRAGQVIGMHFFNPAPDLPLVELTSSLLTDPLVADRAEKFVVGALGKQTIRSPDRTGFVVNALLVPYLLAAVRMVECGHADAETIDAGMVSGCAHPMGPLRLADLIGLDVLAAVATAMYDEFKEPLYAPPPTLLRMVQGGLLGKKAGRGFYRYR